MRVKRIDWGKLIRETVAAGLTQAEISEKVGLAQNAISDLMNGERGEPKYTVGLKIIELHRVATGKG